MPTCARHADAHQALSPVLSSLRRQKVRQTMEDVHYIGAASGSLFTTQSGHGMFNSSIHTCSELC